MRSSTYFIFLLIDFSDSFVSNCDCDCGISDFNSEVSDCDCDISDFDSEVSDCDCGCGCDISDFDSEVSDCDCDISDFDSSFSIIFDLIDSGVVEDS